MGFSMKANDQNEDVLEKEPETKKKVKQPSMYQVLILNDNYTPMDFVIEVIQRIFHKPIDEAEQIMLDVHEKGKGVCGVYTLEIAETKVTEVIIAARMNEHPLMAVVERIG